jgi:hypothetical protein
MQIFRTSHGLRSSLLSVGVVVTSLISFRASAFDYLEHSYFTDRSCRAAQEQLAVSILQSSSNPRLRSAYLALALVCPNRWEVSYCVDGYKQAEANLNRLPKNASHGGGHSITLGDFTALADHLFEFGPVRGLSKAENNGLMANVFAWMAADPKGAGGIAGSIGRTGCKTDEGLAPWTRIESDIVMELARFKQAGGFTKVPAASMFPMARAHLPRGPQDPAGVYSYKNPQFLDMVLRDTHHFGDHAHSAWLGYHSVAVDLAGRRCEDVLGLSKGEIEDLADDLPQFENVRWGRLTPAELRRQGCAVISERIRQRLVEWADRAPSSFVDPVDTELAQLRSVTKRAPTSEEAELLDQVTVSVMGLVFEGVGIHFLQDGLAAGHIRAIHAGRRLGDRRYDHDLDSLDGVSVEVRTAAGPHAFISYGDSYMLGPEEQGTSSYCDWSVSGIRAMGPQQTARCLLQHQRGLLVASTEASLLDWAMGGYLFGENQKSVAVVETQGPCSISEVGKNPSRQFICAYLPLEAPRVPGFESGAPVSTNSARLYPGVLPIPPPPYSYEALTMNIALDPAGGGNQLGFDAAFFSRLGARADWMTTHRVGFRMLTGDTRNRFTADYAYGFHWRFASRLLVDGEPFVFVGADNLRADRDFIAGVGPRFGLTLLPEGWIKIPLELSLSFRMPMTLFSGKQGFLGKAFDVEAYWIQFGIGLAFL